MLTTDGTDFSRFAMLYLDESGRFVDNTRDDDISEVSADELPQFFKKIISSEVFPSDTTDVFVWVHGWQNDELRAITTARKLFANLDVWFKSRASDYPNAGKIVPAFVAVHWPSTSLPGPGGYKKIRNRAKAMTTQGEAEFFLASLLGYLDANNEREGGRKVLRAKGGHFVHCLGHSFGGRFLTAAVKAAATPEARQRKILAAKRDTGFPFNVDSLCVLQMAAGATAFGSEFSLLLEKSPLCGPIVLTHSTKDKALCRWHSITEGEVGVGCNGAAAPAGRIGTIVLRPPGEKYSSADFAHDITNVDASGLFVNGGWAEGGHSDFWHPHTLHLIASVVEQVRG
jgi:hypothetical protein